MLSPIPCLYHLAVHHWAQHKQFHSDLLVAFEWIKNRVISILEKSIPHDIPPVIEPDIVVDGGWKKVQFFYLSFAIF
jgi:hypothetical protein